MSIEITTKWSNSGFMMKLSGDVDIYSYSVLRKNLEGVVRPGGANALLIDLSDVDYIDSVGIWLLVEAGRNCQKRGISFRLVESSPRVREMLGLVRLNGMFDIFPNEIEASGGIK
jgi:anti-anti-sigma factor